MYEYAPSLQASRAEPRLTVYRAHPDFGKNVSSMNQIEFWRPCGGLSAGTALSTQEKLAHGL